MRLRCTAGEFVHCKSTQLAVFASPPRLGVEKDAPRQPLCAQAAARRDGAEKPRNSACVVGQWHTVAPTSPVSVRYPLAPPPSAGPLDPALDHDVLLVGTPADLMCYNVESNSELFFKVRGCIERFSIEFCN